MQSDQEPRFTGRALALWTGLFVLARGWLVLELADVFLYGEEYAKGAAGKALLDRLPLAHWQLAYHPYEGGGFVTSHLNALAFAALGPSLLAQKVVALAFGLATLWVGIRAVTRWFGASAAHAFAALYVFAPASVQKLSLLNLGIHYQALVFSLLVWHTALLVGTATPARRSAWLRYGLACGFGFFFSYQCALTIAPTAVWLAWTRRKELTSAVLPTLAGVALGALPLGYMAWHTGGGVFDIHGAEVAGADDDLPKAEIVRSFFASLLENRGVGGWIGLFALPVAACAGVWAWLRAHGAAKPAHGAAKPAIGAAKPALGLVLVAFVLFLTTYLGSTFAVGDVYHYFRLNRLCPAWLALVLCAAAGCAAATTSVLRRRVAMLAIGVAVGCGAYDVVHEARAGAGGTLGVRVEMLRRFKGYDYRYWLGQVLPRIDAERVEKARIALAFREDAGTWLAAAVGEQVWLDFEGSIDDAILEARTVTPNGELLLGFGALQKRKLGGKLRDRVEWALARPPEDRELLLEALGRFGSRFLSAEDRVIAELEELRGVAAPAALWRGFGWRIFEALGDEDPRLAAYWEPMRPPLWARRSRAKEFVRPFDPEVQEALLAGYDAARAAHLLK
ncbi:MAG: hypothetical protein L6Q99_08425 [Planctomycetes bacterium]|nr:hypothetical protein [Planctomycetota bacterium]